MNANRGRPTGQSYYFRGEKARRMKARLKQIVEERARRERANRPDPED